MARGKRTKLQQNSARSRSTERSAVVIEGQCVIGERGKESALVTDLGLRGCRVRTEAVGVTRSEALQLWLGEVGPISGKLKCGPRAVRSACCSTHRSTKARSKRCSKPASLPRT